nr:hypothetical protein [Escherichia coli]
MFNRLSTCQPAFPHQLSPATACINTTLAQHLADCPATGSATTESMESPHPAS